jgi:hypothetical protein
LWLRNRLETETQQELEALGLAGGTVDLATDLSEMRHATCETFSTVFDQKLRHWFD